MKKKSSFKSESVMISPETKSKKSKGVSLMMESQTTSFNLPKKSRVIEKLKKLTETFTGQPI